ncbi:ATP-binding protein [soil metagenome]
MNSNGYTLLLWILLGVTVILAVLAQDIRRWLQQEFASGRLPGFRRKMNSIRNTLLLWLLVGVSFCFAVAAELAYLQARDEANGLSDFQIRQVVDSIPVLSLSPNPTLLPKKPPAPDDILVQVWDSSGTRIYQSHEGDSFPEHTAPGFFNVDASGKTWRVYNAWRGNTIVQAAQDLASRQRLASHLAMKTIVPLFWLFPFLAALIWITVVQGLASVKRAASDVRARDADLLSPIYDDELPREMRPLTLAFNDLLARLRQAMNAQGAFIGDAAHELKTPLTALKLQMQIAEHAAGDEERLAAFADLKRGLERANHLVHQLLTLARQDPGTYHQKRERLELSALARHAVADFVPLAAAKQIDLGIKEQKLAEIMGNADALRIMLNNLLDNAIRYTPEGGRIDVSIASSEGGASITVEDNGPGIPESDLSRVIDRFYRVPGAASSGSGLGLSIVKQIAKAHKADITLFNLAPGLHVCVTFRAPS